jgi:hypothetical protein
MPRDADWIEYTGTIGKKIPIAIFERGVAKDLSGYTVYLRMWLEKEDHLLINRECIKTDEDNGKVEFTFEAGDLPSSLAGKDLFIQAVLIDDQNNFLPTKVKVLNVKEGAPTPPL